MMGYSKIQSLSPLQFLYQHYPSTAFDNALQIHRHYCEAANRSFQALLQQGFPTEQANCVDNSNRDTACGVSLVYRCYSCSFNMAGGRTTLIERSLMYHAFEKLLKNCKLQKFKEDVLVDVGFPSALHQHAYFTT